MAARLRLLGALATVLAITAGFEFHEAIVDAIQLGFRNGSLTSTSLVRFYLDQIARLNPLLRTVIEVNPDALGQAARADLERRGSFTSVGWVVVSKEESKVGEIIDSFKRLILLLRVFYLRCRW
jgi:hypothetical protein